MVYCGKPSRGCQNCKSRRIKCDETRPHCLNCKKTHRECPGFPQEVDLIFRNETPGIRRKARKASGAGSNADKPRKRSLSLQENEEDADQVVPGSRKRRRKTTENSFYEDDLSVALRRDSKMSNDLPELGMKFTTVEQEATVYFFENFVPTARTTDATRGYLEVAASMYSRAKEDSPLHLATEAVAISVMANWPGRRDLAQLGARLYGRALAATQLAMQDPKEAMSDATLLSILLFALYESITSSEHSVSAWARHIEGAVAIVKARGVKQFDDPQSLLLFRAVRTQMLTNVVQQRRAVDNFPGPKGWLSDLPDDQSGALTVLEFSIALPNLLSAAKSILARNIAAASSCDVVNLLEQAQEIQKALLDWESHMPSQWAHRTAAKTSSATLPDVGIEDMESWPGPIHIYEDVHVSSIRNNNRASQMLCSNVVIDALKWLYPEHYMKDERYRTAKDRIQTLVDEICYSVPFHLKGRDPVKKPKRGAKDRVGSEASGGCLLVWPLYVASNMPCISNVQQRWLKGRLWAISRQYGSEQAGVLNPLEKSMSPRSTFETTSFPGVSSSDNSKRTPSLPSRSDSKHQGTTKASTMLIDPALLAMKGPLQGLQANLEISNLVPTVASVS